MQGESVRLTAAACLLAKSIYYARSEAYELDAPMWDGLNGVQQALYVTQAADILKANRPTDVQPSAFDAFAGLTRAHAAKVVGVITPEAPYGVTR